MYSLLRNTLRSGQQLLEIMAFLIIPSSATGSGWLCPHQPEGRACLRCGAGVGQSQCGMLVGLGVTNPTPGVRLGPSRNDPRSSDAAPGHTERLARLSCRQLFSWPMLRVTFPSHPSSTSHCVLLPVPAVPAPALTAWDNKGTVKPGSGCSASSGKSRTMTLSCLHFELCWRLSLYGC